MPRPNPPRGRVPFAIPLVLSVLALLAACGKPEAQAPGAGGAPPPPNVGVVTVARQQVGLTTELPGRLEASRVAQVRARAAGIVQKRLFREGSDVKAGQPLFAIDPAPYRAAVDNAQANVLRAQANLAQATAQAARLKPLVEANAVSRQDYDNAVAAQKTAEADVAAGRAALQTAQITLGYASVTAPIAGRIGRALVTEGALVGAGEPTPLAQIQQIDPMFVNLTQSTADVLRLRRGLESGQLQRGGSGAAAVQIVLEDGSDYGRPGRLLFADQTVDPTTGQVSLRAEVPNPDGLLLPGMYVRVRLVQAQLPEAILLPQQAVQRGATGDSVMVVGADNKPQSRPVTLGAAQGSNWIVLSGLQPGERVIVDGFQKMMVPGAPVTPVPWTGGASAPAGAPAASSAASAPAPAASARN